MSHWNEHRLVRIDDKYDREDAGGSRYVDYLRKNVEKFSDSDQLEKLDPVRFAMAAWDVATVPVMDPGYVRFRPDLVGVSLHRDEWDGHLYVEVVVPLRHYHIRGPRFPYAWRDWEPARCQHHVPEEFRRLGEPESEGGVTKAILTTTTVRVPGREWPLVTPTATEGLTVYEEASRAVAVIVDRINTEVGPMVAQLLSDA